MSSAILSRRDLTFLLHEWLDVETLAKRPRYAGHSRDTIEAVLDLAERVASEHFAPHNKTNDAHEPKIVDGKVVLIPEVGRALEVFAQTGLLASAMDASVGGSQLPAVVTTAILAYIQAANVGTTSYATLTMGNANLLLIYGSPEQIEAYVRPMAEGRFFGTMCLSEPSAGSSLADVACRAEPQADGSYRLFGNKMWISAGDHELGENIIHLVLARTSGAPAGVKGLSLFIVPKVLVNADGELGERNDVVLGGLNHKMGYRGNTNALLNFGEGVHTPGGEAGAVGFLVGELNRGLTYMFHMMNEARVSVGAGAMALGYTGFLKSLRYAKERPQGRPVTAKDPNAPQIPIIEHADVRRMLLAQKSYVEGALALVLYCGRLLDDQHTADTQVEREEARTLLDVLTPIAKSWPSQWCLEANNLAIQVHGGYGYTREYDVEQHYRDNRLNAIHEGTHGIQGLDLLGRKVVQNNGAGLTLLHRKITETATRAGNGELVEFANLLREAADRILDVTATAWASGDVDAVLAHATAYLEAVGHVVIAWLWLEQMIVSSEAFSGEASAAFYDGKFAAGRYFFRYELPKIHQQLNPLLSLDRTFLETRPEWL